MTPHVVVDIGNTRLKWGLAGPDGRSIARTASLPEDPDAWQRELAAWRSAPPLDAVAGPLNWVLASVRPQRSERLRAWLEARGDRVVLLEKAAQLPLKVGVEHPDWVGIDRLLNGVAATLYVPPGRGAVLIDAGSAVTLDWLDEEHTFRGGAIYPGLDLMAEALHSYTALLPRTEVTWPVPELPAGETVPAMQVGIFLAVSGGIREAVRVYAEKAAVPPRVFFSGGQAPLLARGMGLLDGRAAGFIPAVRTAGASPAARPDPWADYLLWPEQTLVGILRAAEALP
jgi:type III pantothenate kinase